eukprot:TRINITY_DN3145_c0_g5_i5.p1 TRINITY_DN3145_c0_g5~~TRINITY_DN3145_c0_g5_i5.p1  ORF type:complete len:174 (-),score=34.81 TRINITY_DN3145_c0_g5_i5:705-1226(-)
MCIRDRYQRRVHGVESKKKLKNSMSGRDTCTVEYPEEKKKALSNVITQTKKGEDKSNSKMMRTTTFGFGLLMNLCRCLLNPHKNDISIIPLLPPLKDASRKTLVLDLDETLVHSSFDPLDRVDLTLPITIDGSQTKVFVKYRPGLNTFLSAVSKRFEVVIFTASLAEVITEKA